MCFSLFKTSVKKYASKLTKTGFFHVFGSSTINKIISFASGIVLVRILTKSDYGVFSYANNILSLFLLITGLGAASGVLQMCSETGDEKLRKSIYSLGCRLGISFNLLLGVVILCIALFVPLKIEGSNVYLAYMAFLPIFTILHEMQGMFLRSQMRNKDYAYSNTFSTIAVFVLSCTMAYFFNINGLIAAKYAAAIISALFTLIVFRTGISLKKPDVDKPVRKDFLSISSISMVNNGLSGIMYLLDIFVIGLLIPDSAVIASYKVATNIPTALAFIPAAVIIYVYPYFARNKDNKAWLIRNYKKLVAGIGTVCAFISAIMLIFAPFIIRLLFGEAYMDSVPCFRILSLAFFVSGTFRTVAGTILVTQRKLKFNMFVAIFSSLMNTVLNVIFITFWGALGAAIATLATGVVTGTVDTAYLLFVIRKKSDISAEN